MIKFSVDNSFLWRRQQHFAAHYAQTGNGAAAAVAAGYSSRSARVTASRLLTKANVRALVAECQARTAERLEISRERAVAEFQAAAELARVTGDPDAMIAAWREIGRMCGFYSGTEVR